MVDGGRLGEVGCVNLIRVSRLINESNRAIKGYCVLRMIVI